MPTIGSTDLVGDIVAHAPGLARIFERYRIDYCCGGQRALADACSAAGVDVDELRGELEEAAQEASADGTDITGMTLTGLADHIEATHHAYLRRELPRLRGLCDKVAGAHGDRDPRLAEVRHVVHGLADELEQHMRKEELILFPMVRQLDEADGPVAFHCGSLANPVRQMESEHDGAGAALERLRLLTEGFAVPAWGCNTYRAAMAAMEELEADLHRHIHKENNVLFPRALAEETRRGQPR